MSFSCSSFSFLSSSFWSRFHLCHFSSRFYDACCTRSFCSLAWSFSNFSILTFCFSMSLTLSFIWCSCSSILTVLSCWRSRSRSALPTASWCNWVNKKREFYDESRSKVCSWIEGDTDMNCTRLLWVTFGAVSVEAASILGKKGLPGEDMARAPTLTRKDSLLVSPPAFFLGLNWSLGDSSSTEGDYWTLVNMKLGSLVSLDW